MSPGVGTLWDLGEWAYEKIHHLQGVGSILRVGLGWYRGEPLTFSDGTILREGEPVGELHLHNRRLLAFHRHDPRTVFRFRRELVLSLEALASVVASDPSYQAIKAWRGKTWITKGVERFGFELQPIRRPLEQWRLTVHFRALLWHYGGGSWKRSLKPVVLWITRGELLRRYGGL